MLNYKIASRSIAACLLKVLRLIVNKDQTCGVPDRFIGENVAFLHNVADFSTSSGIPATLLSLDQEKGFDRDDWCFLHSTHYAMAFGQSFIGWVDLFYNNACSAVNVNGYVSSPFLLTQGVRQGCPLSPLLYILVGEVLACNIRSHSLTSDLQLPHSTFPLSCVSAYVDDTTFVVTSIHAISTVFDVYSLYKSHSAAKKIWPNVSCCCG